MIDASVAVLALRNRALGTTVCEVATESASTLEEYDETNHVGGANLGQAALIGRAQSFQVAGSGTVAVSSVRFYMDKVLSPTDNMTAKLYASTGSHGSSAVPTGSALGTSDTVASSTLTGSFAWVTFTFATAVSLTRGTTYCVAVEFTGDASNYVRTGVDTSGPTHAGNCSELTATWNATGSYDLIFEVLGTYGLSATSTGYAREVGSFISDGFKVGMEVDPGGFTQDTAGLITSVSALALGIRNGRTVESAAAGRTLTVGIPAARSWEGISLKPSADLHYIEESFVPATSRMMSFPADGGSVEETGLYVLRWYAPYGLGGEALRKSVDALKARVSPGTPLTMSDGSTLRVRADTGPFTGELRRLDGGWVVLTLTVPWLARSVNAVAA